VALSRAVDILIGARRVEVYGIGSAAPVAEDAHIRLLRIGLDARLAVDSHPQAISAAQTGRDVATLTISHSGAALETITTTRLAQEAGARTIVITSVGRSRCRPTRRSCCTPPRARPASAPRRRPAESRSSRS